jgi:hypothetical protein
MNAQVKGGNVGTGHSDRRLILYIIIFVNYADFD